MTRAALAIAAILLASPASATDLAPYVRHDHNLGRGFEPAAVADVADLPDYYMRSPAAWQSLREHVADRLGTRLSDAAFSALLVSERTRLQPCLGDILTAGIDADGKPQWFRRECHEGEQLVAVRVLTGWHVVASQGCWNPVWTPVPGEPLLPGWDTGRSASQDSGIGPGAVMEGGGYVHS